MMGGAPVIEWIRDGVGFTPPAAASFRRAEASWGRRIDCNSSYRDYGLQLSMWQAWTAWTEGRGPKPNHSRAIHPDYSIHCRGEALDSDDWVIPGFIAHMEDHGWIRTAASDPTERHHFEYQWWRDNHRNDPTPAGASEEDDMFTDADRALLKDVKNKLSIENAGYGRPEVIQQRVDAILGRILPEGQPWDQLQLTVSLLQQIFTAVTTLDDVDTAAMFAKMTRDLEASFGKRIAELGGVLRAELLAAIGAADEVTPATVDAAIDAALTRISVTVAPRERLASTADIAE